MRIGTSVRSNYARSFQDLTRCSTGIPFNDTNFRLGIAEAGQSILGDRLLGLQLGNEPDLYGRHGLGGRPSVRVFITDIPQDRRLMRNRRIVSSTTSASSVWASLRSRTTRTSRRRRTCCSAQALARQTGRPRWFGTQAMSTHTATSSAHLPLNGRPGSTQSCGFHC
jgi:hypothetical protein